MVTDIEKIKKLDITKSYETKIKRDTSLEKRTMFIDRN
jgi:hypothetical protein